MSSPYLSKKLGVRDVAEIREKILASLNKKGSGSRRLTKTTHQDTSTDCDTISVIMKMYLSIGTTNPSNSQCHAVQADPLKAVLTATSHGKRALAWISLKLQDLTGRLTPTPRDKQKVRNALGTRKSNQNLATDLSETYHRVDTSRHAGTADTQNTTSDLSVVSQALPETCPAQSGDP